MTAALQELLTFAPRRPVVRSRRGHLRDNQRQRIYDAEGAACHAVGEAKWGQTIKNADLQDYVNGVLERRAIRSRWGRRYITVKLTRGGAHADYYGTEIALGLKSRNPWIILHEIAHCLTPADKYAFHGPEYAGVFLFLVENVLGKKQADALRAAFKEGRVRHNRKAVPAAGTHRVATQAQKQAARKEKESRPLTRQERRVAAEVIRRAAKQGIFGDAGRKPRVHALATARLLDSGS